MQKHSQAETTAAWLPRWKKASFRLRWGGKEKKSKEEKSAFKHTSPNWEGLLGFLQAGCVFWLGGRLYFSITTRRGRGQLPSASHTAFMQGEKKMVQSDLLTCCCCDRLCWSPAYASLLLSSSGYSLSIGNGDEKLLSAERGASASSPAGRQHGEPPGNSLAIFKSSLCRYAATWGCIRRPARSGESKAAKRGGCCSGSRQAELGSACPAQLNSTQVKIMPPSMRFITIQCQDAFRCFLRQAVLMMGNYYSCTLTETKIESNNVWLISLPFLATKYCLGH